MPQPQHRRASCFSLCTSETTVTNWHTQRDILRRFSISTLGSRTGISAGRTRQSKSHGANLVDLPTEILEQIFEYLYGDPERIIQIKRSSGSSDFAPHDLVNGEVRRKWNAEGYPYALLLVNRRFSAIVFERLWCDTAFNLSLSSTDALCFLKYALSERQRVALRRIRFTRFMLSWEDGVGNDIWLTERKQAPAFLAKIDTLPNVPRVNNLVQHLHHRNALVPWVEC